MMADRPDEIDFSTPTTTPLTQMASPHISSKDWTNWVSFIDHRGRVWTTEMTLPENTNMDTVLQIAKASLDLMMGGKTLHLNDLHVLVKPLDTHATTLAQVGRVVVMHDDQIQKLDR